MHQMLGEGGSTAAIADEGAEARQRENVRRVATVPPNAIQEGLHCPGGYRLGRPSVVGDIARQMKIGDSVLCEMVGIGPRALRDWARYNDSTKAFRTRKTREGFRVWRIA